MPESPEQSRNRKALESLESKAKQIDHQVEEHSIKYFDFFGALQQIINILNDKREFDFIINLGGGLRILDFEILSAFTILRRNAKIEVEPETFVGGPVEFEVRDLIPPPLDDVSIEILKGVRENTFKLEEITDAIGISRTTVWRKLKKLEEDSFVSRIGNSMYSITPKGNLILSANEP